MTSLKQLFCDDAGNFSMMRVMSAVSLVAAVATAFIQDNPTLVAIFASTAFGGKIVQKAVEVYGAYVKAKPTLDKVAEFVSKKK